MKKGLSGSRNTANEVHILIRLSAELYFFVGIAVKVPVGSVFKLFC
jgi:hypothetical protein